MLELHDVRIRVPLGTNDSPNVVNVDGSHRHNAGAQELIWMIDLIDTSNSSGKANDLNKDGLTAE